MQRFVFGLMLCLACALGVGRALAADDPFTVTGIPVDASASSSTVAQNIAISDGRARAWTTLFRRLTKTQDWPRQPQLDPTTLQRIIRNYVVSNERRSTTRFVADMTYVFNPDAVRRLMRTQNIPYIDMEAKPVLVVAMAPGYSPRSAWAQLWSNPKFAGAAVPILPPVGDAIDAEALGALNFATAQWSDVEPAASRVHATDVFLAQAVPGKGVITVAVRRLGPGAATPIPNVVVPVRPGESGAQAYMAAADATAAAIVDAWKARSAIDFNKRYKLTAEVRIASMADWGTLMQKLATIPTVMDVSVVAMDSGEARIAVTYVGTAEQLQAFAAQADIALTNTEGAWQLAVQMPPPTPIPAPQ